MELFNNNISCAVTKYKYRGWVCVTTWGFDPEQREAVSHTEDFDVGDPLVARRAAIKWHNDTLAGLKREGRYFLPYASPKDFVHGKNAGFTILVSLVICNGSEEDEYDLLGTDDKTRDNTLEIEEMNLGIKEIPDIDNEFGWHNWIPTFQNGPAVVNDTYEQQR
jgi:hypothetical protein